MKKPLRIAVVGVGRMGCIHAKHVQELSHETQQCQLTAVVDSHQDIAVSTARELQPHQPTEIRPYQTIEQMIAEGNVDAVVVASKTADHYRDAKRLVDAGYRVLLEKPLTDSLQSSKDLANHLETDLLKRNSVMLAFMRRFDSPLVLAKEWLDAGRIGRPFKYTSILEDPLPPPDGYVSPGLLSDMAIHNIDEILWLHGDRPHRAVALGANLYSSGISDVEEDYDDAMLQLWFPGNVLGQIQVSRNHVIGYRTETWIYGEEGMIHVGHIQENPSVMTVNAFGRNHQVIEKRTIELRKYEDKTVPVFVERFGDAYKAELVHFIERCLTEQPFSVTHRDGLLAMQVLSAGQNFIGANDNNSEIIY